MARELRDLSFQQLRARHFGLRAAARRITTAPSENSNGRVAPAVVSTQARRHYFMFDATKFQFTTFQNASTNFGRALR
jgi:hypothetical protein